MAEAGTLAQDLGIWPAHRVEAQDLDNIVLDLHHLHLAGEVCDNQLVSAAEAVAASSLSAVTKAKCLYVFLDNAGTVDAIKPGYLRVIEILLPHIVASEMIQRGDFHPAIKWVEIARAISLSGHGAAAVPFADGIVELSKRRSTDYHCILKSITYPVLLLLRQAGLPAARTVEAEIRARLLDATRWTGTEWVKLAADMCREKDVALVEPLADALIAHVIAERHSKKALKGRARLRTELMGQFCESAPLALDHASGSKSNCPLLCKLHPVLQTLEAVALPAAGRLRAALAELLQAAVAEQVPDQPDLSMPAEAESVGASHPGLRDFLLSTRIEQTFDASKEGRMQIHRLIDDRIPGGSWKLSHESSGCGRSRQLVVRKRRVEQERQRLSALWELREEHRRLLQSMAAHAGS